MWTFCGKFGDAGPSSVTLTYRASVVMRDQHGNLVPLEQNTFDFSANVSSFVEGNALTPRNPATRIQPSPPGGCRHRKANSYQLSPPPGRGPGKDRDETP